MRFATADPVTVSYKVAERKKAGEPPKSLRFPVRPAAATRRP